MNKEKQQIAIAEAHCFHPHPRNDIPGRQKFWTKGGSGYGSEHEGLVYSIEGFVSRGIEHPGLPDYLNDLNAIREAWLTLSNDQRAKFFDWLSFITARKYGGGVEVDPFIMTFSTAESYSEAFLRVVGKWEGL